MAGEDPLNDGSDFSPSLGGDGGGGSSGGSRESFPTIPIEPKQPKPKTPCEKVNSLTNNLKRKQRLKDLYGKGAGTQEFGFGEKIGSNGVSDLISGERSSVDVGIDCNIIGYGHNHTRSGAPIFSPTDFN